MSNMRVAVVGGGIKGLASAHVLAKSGVEATYPNVEFFASLGVEMEVSEMSFSVSLDEGDSYEWVSRNSFSSLFAQKKNVINPYFWKLVREINKFKDDVFSYLELFESNPDIDRPESLGNFINSRGCIVSCKDGSPEMYSGCIIAVRAPVALKLLGKHATFDERRVLGAFHYKHRAGGVYGSVEHTMVLIANRDASKSVLKLDNRRGWWTLLLFTAGISLAKFFFRHLQRKNSPAQARRNISYHYDLLSSLSFSFYFFNSNELFGLFLDETMTYSCAILKTENEDLKAAQLRKISLLIEKARIDEKNEVLENGCCWGSLAIEVFKQIGCKYTGITLSEEQLKFAETKVKQAGLQKYCAVWSM
ncbi:hypothetical protein GH714_021552 [Hevea brasiliensis]|uniref:Cyclopropane-fatty-acyl-phospholipid synthase n=1 Tax=Hevea brasiliensis TaxID=3981 RepID=A0A6A6MQ33_HEVBR|nr:hypothetical protein GH714_021552 [Hevea brasiliensis]